MFEGYGTIVEVVLLKDKRTGERQGIFSLYELLGVVYLFISLLVIAMQYVKRLRGVMSLT